MFSLLLLGAVSCNLPKDASEPAQNGNRYVAEGTVSGTPDDFRVILDNGNELAIRESNVRIPPDEQIDGLRVRVNYTVLSKESADGRTVYHVRLNSMKWLAPAAVFFYDYPPENPESSKKIRTLVRFF
jgi:hypothetical protein